MRQRRLNKIRLGWVTLAGPLLSLFVYHSMCVCVCVS